MKVKDIDCDDRMRERKRKERRELASKAKLLSLPAALPGSLWEGAEGLEAQMAFCNAIK